jgi:hypothetical protein
MELQSVFDRLWTDYSNQNPSVRLIHDLFIHEGEEVVNDHIAGFRATPWLWTYIKVKMQSH